MNYCAEIRKAREAKGLKRKSLAGIVGVSKADIEAFETGEKVPGVEEGALMEFVLGVPYPTYSNSSNSNDPKLMRERAAKGNTRRLRKYMKLLYSMIGEQYAIQQRRWRIVIGVIVAMITLQIGLLLLALRWIARC